MSQDLAVDLKEVVLSNGAFGPAEVATISQAISEDYSQFAVLRDAVSELEMREDLSPATSVRLGVCYFLLGSYDRAAGTLASADGGAMAHFYLGRSHFANEDYEKAIEAFNAAKVGGYDGDQVALSIAECQRYAGEPQAGMTTLDELYGPVEQTAEYLYQRGAMVAALGGNPEEVVALYERAVSIDEDHAGALFGLALENDRRGNDSDALEMYTRATKQFPTHVGALVNLGLLYEDLEHFDRAADCYRRVLTVYPAHERARLYLKDAEASVDLVDLDDQFRRDQYQAVLATPVTDFELSVRSRNCLEKMGIRTLGDLTRISESDLLNSKNFGETSLEEIRNMMQSKGLSLGQNKGQHAAPETSIDVDHMSDDERAMMDRPIAELNLSVRARKCMTRLGLHTIGDLIRKTGDDLLECKNFGVTSLNEVRDKLTQYGLKLRGE